MRLLRSGTIKMFPVTVNGHEQQKNNDDIKLVSF